MLDLLVITGASKGIGSSIVAKCATICKTMIVIASSEKIETITNTNCRIIPIRADLSKHDQLLAAVYDTISKLGAINSLGIVLCGAQLGQPGGLFDSNLNNWDTLYQCNVLGNLAVIQGCADIIKSGAKTRIAFFAGGGAAFGYPEFSAYSLSKAAIVRAAENLGMELFAAGYDASVIAIAPGAVATDMLAKVIASGAEVRTKTDISEPTNFVYNFLTDKFPTKKINGKFLHVRDAADAYVLAIEKPITNVKGIFNLGSDDLNYQLNDIGGLIKSSIPHVQIAHTQNIDKRNYRVSFLKIRKALGFNPKLSISDGIEEIKKSIMTKKIRSWKDPIYYNNRFPLSGQNRKSVYYWK